MMLVHWARHRSSGSGSTDRYEQLKKLADLKGAGILTEPEFESEKARLLTSAQLPNVKV